MPKVLPLIKPLKAAALPKIAPSDYQAPEAAPAPKPAPAPVQAYGGSHQDWMAAAGIPESDWWAVDYIVSRESSWDPCAYYPGRSDCTTDFMPGTACGLVMTLPCGKAGNNWRDPVAALIWQKSYVAQRFGGYAGAVAYWQANGNY